MKLASLKHGRDGRLVVVSQDLNWFTDAFLIAPTLQAALDDWDNCGPRLQALAESLVRYLVAELAPRGVRINAVAPGLVHTTSVAGMVGGEDAAQRVIERAARSNPSGRLAEDDDYTAVVEFLLSPGSAFVQGQVIHANGGAYVPA